MRSHLTRWLVISTALVGGALFVVGVCSCVVNDPGGVGPIAFPHNTHVAIRDGVASVRQITGHEPAVTSSDWDAIDPLLHPERIYPQAPGFPWFGYSADRQMGMAIPLPGADVDSVHRGGPHQVIPANIRVVFFPIWLPAIVLLMPWLAGVRSRRRGQIATLASRGEISALANTAACGLN